MGTFISTVAESAALGALLAYGAVFHVLAVLAFAEAVLGGEGLRAGLTTCTIGAGNTMSNSRTGYTLVPPPKIPIINTDTNPSLILPPMRSPITHQTFRPIITASTPHNTLITLVPIPIVGELADTGARLISYPMLAIIAFCAFGGCETSVAADGASGALLAVLEVMLSAATFVGCWVQLPEIVSVADGAHVG